MLLKGRRSWKALPGSVCLVPREHNHFHCKTHESHSRWNSCVWSRGDSVASPPYRRLVIQIRHRAYAGIADERPHAFGVRCLVARSSQGRFFNASAESSSTMIRALDRYNKNKATKERHPCHPPRLHDVLHACTLAGLAPPARMAFSLV